MENKGSKFEIDWEKYDENERKKIIREAIKKNERV